MSIRAIGTNVYVRVEQAYQRGLDPTGLIIIADVANHHGDIGTVVKSTPEADSLLDVSLKGKRIIMDHKLGQETTLPDGEEVRIYPAEEIVSLVESEPGDPDDLPTITAPDQHVYERRCRKCGPAVPEGGAETRQNMLLEVDPDRPGEHWRCPRCGEAAD